MMEPTQEEIQKTVSTLFDITDIDISLTKMKFSFSNIDFIVNFVILTQVLEGRNLVCFLERKNDGIFLIVSTLSIIENKD